MESINSKSLAFSLPRFLLSSSWNREISKFNLHGTRVTVPQTERENMKNVEKMDEIKARGWDDGR